MSSQHFPCTFFKICSLVLNARLATVTARAPHCIADALRFLRWSSRMFFLSSIERSRFAVSPATPGGGYGGGRGACDAGRGIVTGKDEEVAMVVTV